MKVSEQRTTEDIEIVMEQQPDKAEKISENHSHRTNEDNRLRPTQMKHR